jgi:DNA-binding NarL/FixJ family response regulator
MDSPLRIIFADDHPLYRKGLRQVVEEDASVSIVGETGDGESAFRLIEELRPDVAVLDIDMPHMSGLQIAKKLQEKNFFVAVVILTIYKQEDMFNEAMDWGVRGYVLKETAAVDILDAIKTVADGRYYISPILSTHLVVRSRRAQDLLNNRQSLSDLTKSERRILRLISHNKTSKDIGAELNISHRTVETHRTNIATKLNIHGSHALLKFALENKSVLSTET